MDSKWLRLAALASACLTSACTGNVGQRSDDDPSSPSASGDKPKPPKGTGGNPMQPGPDPGPSMGGPGATASAAVAPLRRLTAEQYRNTVRDLLGLTDPIPVSALPGDDSIADHYFSNVDSPLETVDIERYGDLAETLATKAVAKLATLVPCDPAMTGEAACAATFIASFGRRAYRRPLTSVEIERLKQVYAAGSGFADGIQGLVSAFLQSPKFLYLPESLPAQAAPGAVVPVDQWAMASRLSYFLLGSMPDDPLLDAAAGNQLGTAEQIAAQAKRLMADKRFVATLTSFHGGWLLLRELEGAEKDPMIFPAQAWSPELKTALGEESRRFVEYVFTQGDGRLETLLSAPFSMLSGPLYAHYGVTAPAGAAAGTWQRAELNQTQRAGLLTSGAVLAAQAHADRTSFILRGKLVAESLLCAAIAPPPPNVPDTDKTLPATATAQERSMAHRVNPSCATCHALFDPIGFAFESYDGVGRWRDKEANGKAIDTHVEITQTATLDGPVAGAVELAQKLSASGEVRDCVARQWTRFAFGRMDDDNDAPSLQAAQKAFKDADGKIADLLVALARSDSFRYQKVATE
jgi:hypothetical protein